MKSFAPTNINDSVRVKLSDHGQCLYADSFVRVGLPARLAKVDSDGFSSFQMWDLMHIFGPHIGPGGDLPFETDVLVQVTTPSPFWVNSADFKLLGEETVDHLMPAERLLVESAGNPATSTP